ncbi:MAG TPA: hypothetical protein VGX78_14845 [Pirellulales bacterium]|jgi:hypothetical protein|nr:hypothetical protein [Pirellulales bacterium]
MDVDENPYKPPSVNVQAQRRPRRWLINAGWTALGAMGGLAIIVFALLMFVAIVLMRRGR